MLGRNSIGDLTRLLHALGEDESAAVVDGLLNDGAPGHVFDESLHGSLYTLQILWIWTEQNALRQLIVLGLREQIHGNPVSRR